MTNVPRAAVATKILRMDIFIFHQLANRVCKRAIPEKSSDLARRRSSGSIGRIRGWQAGGRRRPVVMRLRALRPIVDAPVPSRSVRRWGHPITPTPGPLSRRARSQTCTAGSSNRSNASPGQNRDARTSSAAGPGLSRCRQAAGAEPAGSVVGNRRSGRKAFRRVGALAEHWPRGIGSRQSSSGEGPVVPDVPRTPGAGASMPVERGR